MMTAFYVILSDREAPCYIPDDAWQILKEYMDQRFVCETLFYNRSGRPLNTMYISRMMKKYCSLAGIRNYSAQAVRNSCAFNMFAYGATDGQTARPDGEGPNSRSAGTEDPFTVKIYRSRRRIL